MAFQRRWLLILYALLLGGSERLLAAHTTHEERAYAAAVSAFNGGMYLRAEAEFEQFVNKYHNSTNVPMAVLLEAQAQYKQRKFTQAITLLESRRAQAGSLADQYVYWIGEAQFAVGDYRAAAATFSLLTSQYPDSPLRLRAVVEAASAYARLHQWRNLDALLDRTNGVFQQAMQLDPANQLVLDGQLVRENSKYQQRDFTGVAAVYKLLTEQWPTLKSEQQRQATHLFYLAKMAAGEYETALAAATNLVQIARLQKFQSPVWRADAYAAEGAALEKLNRGAEAIGIYSQNLTNTAPVAQQQEAVLKIAELSANLKQFSEAETHLQTFLALFPDSPRADLARLTLGELHLKDYIAEPVGTNHLQLAWTNFDDFIATFTNSPLLGKAYLDRGWCEWLSKDLTNSLADFETAAQKKLSPEDLAVAKFKIGDALFARNNFKGALTNYQAVLNDFPGVPSVKKQLTGLALYQSLRADLELGNTAAAGEAFTNLFQEFSNDELGQAGSLLYGESLVQPDEARALLEKLAAKFSGSSLEPQVKLAVARTYEQEQNWPEAVTNYENWLSDFPTNRYRPQAEYALALANFHVGNETNALALFNRFVAQNGTNTLAPLAQWWIAGHFYREGEYIGAETNYERIYQDWPASELAGDARMMAGRAAMARQSPSDASRYFLSIISDTNCPATSDLGAQARFACAEALMQMPSPDTNNPAANYMTATNYLSQLLVLTNETGARAWGEIGDCAMQLNDFDAATNAYAQVFSTNSAADISTRSAAQVAFGIALEKIAALPGAQDRTNLLLQALNSYLDVFDTRFGKNDPFWVHEAGLQALPLLPLFHSLNKPDVNKYTADFITQMEHLFPQARDSLEKKRAALLVEKK